MDLKTLTLGDVFEKFGQVFAAQKPKTDPRHHTKHVAKLIKALCDAADADMKTEYLNALQAQYDTLTDDLAKALTADAKAKGYAHMADYLPTLMENEDIPLTDNSFFKRVVESFKPTAKTPAAAPDEAKTDDEMIADASQNDVTKTHIANPKLDDVLQDIQKIFDTSNIVQKVRLSYTIAESLHAFSPDAMRKGATTRLGVKKPIPPKK